MKPLTIALSLTCIMLIVGGCGFAKKEKKAAEAEEQTRLFDSHAANDRLLA